MTFTPKTHLGIYGVLVRENKILMIKKARGPYTGKFDLPGGKLEHGESLEEGLRREWQEETGVTVNSMKLLTNLTTRCNFEYEGESIDMYQVGLIYEITDADTSTLQENTNFEDSQGAVWVDPAKVSESELSPFAQEAVRQFRP
jgi:mutator protein MutT